MSSDRQRLNEHRHRMFGRDGRRVVYLCECSGVECWESVTLAATELELLRPGLILADGHAAARADLRPETAEPDGYGPSG